MIDVVTVEYAVLVTVIVRLETAAPTPTPTTKPTTRANTIKIAEYFMALESTAHRHKNLPKKLVTYGEEASPITFRYICLKQKSF